MTTALALALRLGEEINSFPLNNCGPSDDPDKQYAYVAEFRDIARRFVGAVKRIGDPQLSSLLVELNIVPEVISEAHDLRADLYVVIDALNEAAQRPDYAINAVNNSAFLNTDILIELKALQGKQLDPKKLVRMCEELNDAYARGNYISSALLLRAIMNHVPSVFGVATFAEVAAQSGRSVKAILTRLNTDARTVADLHTHFLMRSKEQLPTKDQIEPYKPGFEILMQEVLRELSQEKI